MHIINYLEYIILDIFSVLKYIRRELIVKRRNIC